MTPDDHSNPNGPDEQPTQPPHHHPQQPPADGARPRPATSPSEFEAETYIGHGPPGTEPPSAPKPPKPTRGTPTARPGKPGAWSSTGSTILNNPAPTSAGKGGGGRPISDSWDQTANAVTVAPGGGDSGFGSANTLSRGHIGQYPVERELGRGGMGVVYLGRDENLGREVAIKVLPDMFAQHPERLARFEREARLLASLNHANIAAIYELGEDNGARFLVLEYVPGLTLSERLHGGALPMDESLHICAQIAEGLEAAHEKGVIHRDLKPGNVKITPEGIVKVLDFGLAKASGPDSSSPAHPDSATAGIGDTQEGMILGTAGYMSPEQARGRALDKRTDVWSFGCVLFECLTGRSPFYSDTVSDTIALILRTDPDWAALPPETPEKVRELLQRCFIKDPKRRLRDLGEARIELQTAHESVSSFGAAGSPSGSHGAPAKAAPTKARSSMMDIDSWWQYVPWAMAGLSVAVAAIVTAVLITRDDAGPVRGRNASIAGVIRFALTLPPGAAADARGPTPLMAISDDERGFVVNVVENGRRQMYVRMFDRERFQPVAALAGGAGPFFSPDSQHLGILQPGSIQRITIGALAGGRGGTTTVVDGIMGEIAGATWTDDAQIIFAVTSGSGKGLYRAPALSSSRVGELVLAAENQDELVCPRSVRGNPDLLIYTARTPTGSSVRWLSLKDPANKNGTIIERGGSGFIIGKGTQRHLVYAIGGSLVAQSVRVTSAGIVAGGGVETIAAGIASDRDATRFALSDDGLLIYLPEMVAQRTVRSQTLSPVIEGASQAAQQAADMLSNVAGAVRIDPNDPSRIASISSDPSSPVRVVRNNQSVAVRGVLGKVTSLAWRPRSNRRSTLTLGIFNGGQTTLREWDEATGQLSLLARSGGINDPLVHTWNADGSTLYLSADSGDSGRDLLFINENGKFTLPSEQGDEFDATISPSGRQFAFTLTIEGSPQVHLRRSGDESPHSLVLPGSPSWAPLWIDRTLTETDAQSGAGTLLVMRPDGLHAVAMSSDPLRPFGKSTRLVEMTSVPGSPREYDAAPDGSWVLLPVAANTQGSEVRVVVNFDDLVAVTLQPAQ